MDDVDILQKWKHLFEGFNEDLVEKSFCQLKENYDEPGRLYHNLRHIGQLLDLSEKFKSGLHDQTIVDLAIFFHDIVYQAGKNDNELQSAGVAEKMLSELKVPEDIILKVGAYILATKDHFAVITEDSDLKYFLDFDLSILSSGPEAYKLYASQIRQEYAAIPDVFYNQGRITFLEKSLQLGNLYFTAEFRDTESKARANIEWEIQKLRQG